MNINYFLITFLLTFLTLESGYKVANALDERLLGSSEIKIQEAENTNDINSRKIKKLAMIKKNHSFLYSIKAPLIRKRPMPTMKVGARLVQSSNYKVTKKNLAISKVEIIKTRVQYEQVSNLKIDNDKPSPALNTKRPYAAKIITQQQPNSISWNDHLKNFNLSEKFQVAEMVSKLAAEKKSEMTSMTSHSPKGLLEKLARQDGPIEPLMPQNSQKVVEDEVTLVESSTKQGLASMVEDIKVSASKQNQSDELVFIDLKELKHDEDDTKASAYITENISLVSEDEHNRLESETIKANKVEDDVKQLIEKEFKSIIDSKKSVVLSGQDQVERTSFRKSSDHTIVSSQPDYSSTTSNNKPNNDSTRSKVNGEKKLVESFIKSNIQLTTFGVNINGIDERLGQYDFIHSHDPNLVFSSDSEGIITYEQQMSSSESILSGTILKRSYIHTNVDLPIEAGEFNYKIPLIEKAFIVDLLEKFDINGMGAFALIDLGQEIKNFFIDKTIDKIVYLNEQFKVVTKSHSRYAILLGVEPGNALLSLELKSDERVEKLIHLVENELYYEMALFEDSENKKYSLYELAPMSRDPKELSLNESQINYFNSSYSPTKVGFNEFEFEIPVQTTGMRNYIELKHMSDVIFVGANEKADIYVPNEYFIADVLSVHQLPSLENSCMVQLNLSKPVAEMSAFGNTTRGPMDLSITYLDADGMYAQEVSNVSRFAFLRGDIQGIINVKINYLDNSSDILQTFCSNGTYLLEQL